MKKIFGALSLAVLFLSGCIKGDDSYKEVEPIIPGMNIYNAGSRQNGIAMQPANAGMRLAVLLAEAEKQGETDLTKVLDKDKKSVLSQLFGSTTKIEKTEGDYKIAYNSGTQMYDGFYLKGSLIVKTGGTALSETTSAAAWTVELSDDFQVQQTGMNGARMIVEFSAGATALYSNGDGSYSVVLDQIAATIEEATATSAWSGTYHIRPDAPSLAFSDCDGKDFTVAGSMSGPSIFTLNSTGVSTEMSFNLSNVKYKFAGQVFTGTVTVRLTGLGDYDREAFPSNEVKFVWSLNDNTLSNVIYYNGYVYPKQ